MWRLSYGYLCIIRLVFSKLKLKTWFVVRTYLFQISEWMMVAVTKAGRKFPQPRRTMDGTPSYTRPLPSASAQSNFQFEQRNRSTWNAIIEPVTMRPAESGFGPRRNPPPPTKGGPAKNLCTKSERLTLSCRVTWAWSERVNLYNRQRMIYYRERRKHMRHSEAPDPLLDRRAPAICTGFPPSLSSAVVTM